MNKELITVKMFDDRFVSFEADDWEEYNGKLLILQGDKPVATYNSGSWSSVYRESSVVNQNER